MEQQEYTPKKLNTFAEFDRNVESCYTDITANKKQIPSTLEGCIMRISDIIAYIGKDRQDAAKIGLVPEQPPFSSGAIGTTNAEIINNMTVSIIEKSYGNHTSAWTKKSMKLFPSPKKKTMNGYMVILKLRLCTQIMSDQCFMNFIQNY